MANIQDKIDKIKTAIFGKEVRGALADGIEAINKEVESTTGKQSHLEETFDQLIINAGTSNAEVVDARVDKTTGQTYQKLGDRLDKHSEQMDSIVAKNNEADTITKAKINTKSITNFINKCIYGKVNYAILGDSITDTGVVTPAINGGASNPQNGYAQVLHRIFKAKFGDGVSFTNRGVGGNNVQQALARFDTEILPFNYDMIGLELGTNDWNQQNDLSYFRNIYRALILRCLNETNADIFLVGLGYFENWKPEKTIREEEYNQVIKELAREYNLCFIDTREAMINYMAVNNKTFADMTYAPDPVHPNDLGHSIWANACYDVFDNFQNVYMSFRDYNGSVIGCLDGDILYSNGWVKEGKYTTVLGGYIKSNSSVNSFFNVNFYGTGIELYFVCDNTRSSNISIQLDGVDYLSNISTRSTNFKIMRVTIDNLNKDIHDIKVINNVAEKLSINYAKILNSKKSIKQYKTKIEPQEILISDYYNGVDTNADYKFGKVIYVTPTLTDLNSKNVALSVVGYFKKAKIYYTANTNCGIVECYIDGKLVKTVDMYNATLTKNSTFEVEADVLDVHRLKIVVTGKNSNSTSCNFYLGGITFANNIDISYVNI